MGRDKWRFECWECGEEHTLLSFKNYCGACGMPLQVARKDALSEQIHKRLSGVVVMIIVATLFVVVLNFFFVLGGDAERQRKHRQDFRNATHLIKGQ